MLLSSSSIRVYDQTPSSNGNFFTGGLNFHNLENYDPLITGYAFIIWDNLPGWVEAVFPNFKYLTQKNFISFNGISDIELQTAEYNYGFSNNSYNVPAGIQKGNTEFSLTHKELSGSPIKNGYQFWVSGINDPETGISEYGAAFNIDYSMANHSCSMTYIVTRPDANNIERPNIEFSAYYTNVFPTKIPIGHFNYTQGTHDTVDIEQSFKGTIHLGPKVDAYAASKLREAYMFLTEGNFDPSGNETITNDITGGRKFSGLGGNSGQSIKQDQAPPTNNWETGNTGTENN